MRKIATIPFTFVLLILFATSVFGQLPSNHLEGTWRLISQQSVYPDTTIITKNPPPSIKILNSTHFSWGYQSDSGEEVLAGGGRYTLKDDTLYTEYIEYHTSEPLVGQAKVIGDIWYHTGVFPSGYRSEEVWRRIE
ncbi:MAG: hypothetical protein IH820_17505 [Bacteroidetes bacterium]|nr:hypothetical protein [Bacteroidota bacterium]